jgi:adenylyl-sulfate kinase
MTVKTYIKWHSGKVHYAHRCQLLQQKGIVLWLTGLSGAGKSTLAVELESTLHDRGILTYRLDGDNMRHGLSRGLTFTEKDRLENVRRIACVASLFREAGLITIVSCISPRKNMRQLAKEIIGEKYFIEVFVKASLDICRQRDPKNLYRKVDEENINQFTGIDAHYDLPEAPVLTLETDKLTVNETKNKLLKYLVKHHVV